MGNLKAKHQELDRKHTAAVEAGNYTQAWVYAVQMLDIQDQLAGRVDPEVQAGMDLLRKAAAQQAARRAKRAA